MTAPTLASLAADLAAGRTTSRALVEACLARISDPAGEGTRAFISVAGEQALAAADGQDALRRAGAAPSPFAGIPVAIKDLFDVAVRSPPPARRCLPPMHRPLRMRRLLRVCATLVSW